MVTTSVYYVINESHMVTHINTLYAVSPFLMCQYEWSLAFVNDVSYLCMHMRL